MTSRAVIGRLATLLLVALLVLFATAVSAPVAVAQGESAANLGIQIQTEAQKVAAHEERASTIETQIDAHNDAVATHNTKVDALQQQVSATSAKASSVDGQIAAHNAEPHEFQLPQQAGAAAEYDSEAAALNSQKDELASEAAGEQAQQSQLDSEGSQLAQEEQQERAEVAAYNQEGTQLSAECQQLLQQAAALLAAGSEPTSPQSSSLTPGGDQSSPSPSVGGPRQVTGDGGDPVSRQRQNDALDAYAKANDVTVDERPVTAALTPGAVGKLPPSAVTGLQLTRTYDGLVREPSGDYEALEVPSSTTGVTPGSKGIDDAINAGGKATALVDGEPVIIDKVASVPSKPLSSPTTNCGANCRLISDGTPTTATVSPRKLLDDAKALQDTVPKQRDRYVTVATGQLGGDLVYAVNQNGTNIAMRNLAAKLGYQRVFATDLNPGLDTDAEQILFNAIDEGEEDSDGIIAASRPACGPVRPSGAPGQNCAGRAMNYPDIQLWDQPRNG
ncbi:MAG TPA: hypothetical protein VGN81_26600, partial [Pseudonocardiaceae bacterium]|jgi:uncharacterized coiled-coil protein SlyX